MKPINSSYSNIVTSFLLSMCLEMLPWARLSIYLHPSFVTICLSYWITHSPQKVGLFFALGLGFCVDIIHGNILGTQGFIFVILAFLAHFIQNRLRSSEFSMYLIVTSMLLLLDRLLHFALNTLLNIQEILWQSLISLPYDLAVCPLLFMGLQKLQKRQRAH
jgi:rod shape-determining protein MreD